MSRLSYSIALIVLAVAGLVFAFLAPAAPPGLPPGARVQQSQAAFTDYRRQSPGTIRKITVADLPEPYQTKSADNRARIVPRPANAWPRAMAGFTVTEFAAGLVNPRLVRRAANGDLFVAESEPGRVRVLRGLGANGKAQTVSVGSHSNDDDTDNNPVEFHRADILQFNPDGSGGRVYAWGIRNAVGIAVNPSTGELWASVNERDGLGDNLVPDYITHVQEGGFYGWPWFYIGGHQDPRQQGKHPELRSKSIVPDVLLQPHNASLEMTFYEGGQFPSEYDGDAFAAEHGSWNKAVRTGYEVIRVPMKDGHATGEYQDFLTGFVTPGGDVWGRPVGVAVANDGSLIVTDDGSNTVWRVAYTTR